MVTINRFKENLSRSGGISDK